MLACDPTLACLAFQLLLWGQDKQAVSHSALAAREVEEHSKRPRWLGA